MDMKSAIADLQMCKQNILKKSWGTLFKRPLRWKNNARTVVTVILRTLRQREDFTDEQIIIIGLRLDEWTVNWISLVGREGMTNYTHLMTSGHIVYYLKYWRNFYCYSNQRWHQFNWQYRYMYCHRTQKGGSSGTHGKSG
jgi:hypothetical protein